ITSDGEVDVAPKALVAAAVLVTAGLVPGVAQAGNDDFCAQEQVCIYDSNDWVGFLESRPPGLGIRNTWSWAEDSMDSWENRTGTDAAWYHDRNGKGRCVTLRHRSEDGNINVYDSDELSSWKTNGGC
ncbi:MAG TPA: hypothetical protein VGP02_16495, partial [Mycobacteriales bacterium]|nr:hypothetical protein [Mycobacteriales bacterium]